MRPQNCAFILVLSGLIFGGCYETYPIFFTDDGGHDSGGDSDGDIETEGDADAKPDSDKDEDTDTDEDADPDTHEGINFCDETMIAIDEESSFQLRIQGNFSDDNYVELGRLDHCFLTEGAGILIKIDIPENLTGETYLNVVSLAGEESPFVILYLFDTCTPDSCYVEGPEWLNWRNEGGLAKTVYVLVQPLVLQPEIVGDDSYDVVVMLDVQEVFPSDPNDCSHPLDALSSSDYFFWGADSRAVYSTRLENPINCTDDSTFQDHWFRIPYRRGTTGISLLGPAEGCIHVLDQGDCSYTGSVISGGPYVEWINPVDEFNSRLVVVSIDSTEDPPPPFIVEMFYSPMVGP